MSNRSRIDILVFCLLSGLAVLIVSTAGAMTIMESNSHDSAPLASSASEDQPPQIQYLSPDTTAIEQDGYTETGLDVSSGVATDAQDLRSLYTLEAFKENHDAITTVEESDAYVGAQIDAITETIDSLHAYQSQLITQYNAGEISTATFARELLRTNTAAKNQLEVANSIEQFSTEVSTPDILDVDSMLLPAPVLERYQAATRGEESPGSIYVETADDALVLAAPGETHIRQALLRSERDVGGDNQFAPDPGDIGIEAAVNRSGALYPWASTNLVQYIADTVYLANMEHPHTTVNAYIDGATTNSFYEIQTVSANQVPTTVQTNSSNGVELSVGATQATGPLSITVHDAITDEPVDATIQINDQRVGTTGGDGELWAVQPRGSFEVIATTDEERIVLTAP